MSLLAVDYRLLNQLEKAEALALRAVELRRSALGEEHPVTVGSICILANISVRQQPFDQAGLLTEQALTLCRRLPLEKSVFLAGHLSNLGWAYLEQGKVAEAGTLCELALQATRRKPDANPLANASTFIQLGAVRLAQEKYAEAEMLLREGSSFAEKYWADAAYRFYVLSLLGASLSGQKKYADAEPFLLQGYEGLQQRQASVPPYLNAPRRITESFERLVQLYDAWSKPAQATEWKQKLAAFQQATKATEKKGAQP
jgi:eukaryotic-like serine/threonine-protein kinase